MASGTCEAAGQLRVFCLPRPRSGRLPVVSALQDKVVLITGSASGIGRATALACAREGARLVLADREDAGRELATEIEGALFVRTDVRRAAEVEEAVSRAVLRFGRLDGAFNNAGIGIRSTQLHEVEDESWRDVLETNLTGTWYCLKHEIVQMLRQGAGGTIVNNASVLALRGGERLAAYSASKHGILGLTRSAALEYGPGRIRVNAVCPGFILTPMTEAGYPPQVRERVAARTPLGRLGEPTDVAEAVVWLLSDAASFVTGQTITSDGGMGA
ncbi:MAG: SDR family oxidoreductase [Candidatus Riflebacteria bacterium]|nr:SDR family oxidoreductase [Candidatus Riflebacteria bacterium]